MISLFILQSVAEPLLLLKKSIGSSSSAFTLDSDVIVNLHIFNIGDGIAQDIVVFDDWDTERFTLQKGLATVSWDKLLPGQNVSHSFTLRSNLGGDYKTTKAVVNYKDVKTGETKSTFASSLGTVKFYEWKQAERRSGGHYKEWLMFVLFAGLVLAVPTVVYGNVLLNYKYGLPIELAPKLKTK